MGEETRTPRQRPARWGPERDGQMPGHGERGGRRDRGNGRDKQRQGFGLGASKGTSQGLSQGVACTGHIASTSVFGLGGKPPKGIRLMCPLSIQRKAISGQMGPGLTFRPA